jgi:hypothetical protein
VNLKPIHSFKSSAIALIVGIASGFATAAAARFGSELDPFIGLFFGGALVFILWIEHNKCSTWLVTTVLASSIASYCAAIWGTLYVTGTIESISPNLRLTDPFGPGMFSIAGFLGALVLNLALLLLLSPKRGLSILWKAAIWALAGSALGFISAELADSVGAAIKAVIGIPRTDMGNNNYYMSLYSAYLIWQTGMALLIPRLLPTASVSQAGEEIIIPYSPARLSWAGKLFFGVIFIVALFSSYSVAISSYRSWQYQRSIRSQMNADAEHRAAAQREKQEQMALSIAAAPPGLQTLHTVKRPSKAVLILSRIGIYSPLAPSAMERSPFQNSEPDEYILPSRVNYSVSYDGGSADDGSSSQRPVSVIITQYPNNDWAQYELRNTPEPNMEIWHSPAERLPKFGNQILRYSVLRYPQAYYWTSGDKIIVVYCNPEDDAVLAEYLKKYPSSLGR